MTNIRFVIFSSNISFLYYCNYILSTPGTVISNFFEFFESLFKRYSFHGFVLLVSVQLLILSLLDLNTELPDVISSIICFN